MRLEPLLSESTCLVLRDAADRASIFSALSQAAAGVLEAVPSAAILAGLVARETDMPTTTPEGVAFPHTVLDGVHGAALVLATVTPPIRFRPSDRAPIRLVACIVGNREKPFEHVRLLARLARILRTPEARERLAGAADGHTLYTLAIGEDRALG